VRCNIIIIHILYDYCKCVIGVSALSSDFSVYKSLTAGADAHGNRTIRVCVYIYIYIDVHWAIDAHRTIICIFIIIHNIHYVMCIIHLW
jgi:hypothetical protein